MEKGMSMQLEQLLSCCRLCLEKPLNVDQLQPLFPGDLPQQLFQCTGIRTVEDQRLSSLVCTQCVENLTDSFAFTVRCSRSHDILQSLLVDVKEEICSELEYDRLASGDEKVTTLSVCNIKKETVPGDSFSYRTVEIYHDKGSDEDDKTLNNFKSSETFHPSSEMIKCEPLHPGESFIDSGESYSDKIPGEIGKKSSSKYRSKTMKIKVKLKKMKKQKSRQLLECDICNLLVRSYSAMVAHMRTHTGEKPFACKVCERSFSQKATLRVHMEGVHPNEEQKKANYPCETCGKLLKSKKNLKIHLRIHTGETPYECPFCFKCFNQIGTLITHKRRHTGEKPFVCVTCGKAFAEHNHLKRHQSVHTDERPFHCDSCDAKFKNATNLKLHRKLHTNEKESVCEECGLSYQTKGSLDAHKRRVHSEKSGQCNVCKLTFPNLTQHMVKHTGEKPFHCKVCDKRFPCIRGLKIHNRLHKSEDKFECTVEGCDRIFNAQWLLRNHLMKHTGELPHSCKICSKSYFRICDLTKHIKLVHPNAE